MNATPERRKSRTSIYVSILSANPETLDGLQSYLDGVGVQSHCTRALSDIDMVAPQCATAAVIFPDDFQDDRVLALVRRLRHTRPHLLALLVTREPQRFHAVAEADDDSMPAIVLPKPSFGWDILDAIRAHAHTAHHDRGGLLADGPSAALAFARTLPAAHRRSHAHPTVGAGVGRK